MNADTVQLVPFTEAHITPKYLGWLNDKNLMRYSRNRFRDHTEASAREYLASMDGPFYAILHYGEHAGNVAAYIDRQNLVADLTILVGKTQMGIGSVAWNLAIDRVFEETDVRKIEAGTHGLNKGMLAIFKASAMTEEGRRRKHFFERSAEADLVQYGIHRDDWEQATHDARGLP